MTNVLEFKRKPKFGAKRTDTYEYYRVYKTKGYSIAVIKPNAKAAYRADIGILYPSDCKHHAKSVKTITMVCIAHGNTPRQAVNRAVAKFRRMVMIIGGRKLNLHIVHRSNKYKPFELY
jgi:hypothetical protein